MTSQDTGVEASDSPDVPEQPGTEERSRIGPRDRGDHPGSDPGESGQSALIRWGRLLILVAIVVATLAAARGSGITNLDELTATVDDAGPAAPVVFVGAYALLTVALAPGSVGSAAAGLLFGPVLGTVVTVIGATIGATAAFFLGRWLGRDAVRSIAGRGADRVDEFVGVSPLKSVLALRLLPVLPFNLVNYGAGLTRLPARDYVLGTAVGIIPGSILFVTAGSSLDNPGSLRFFVSVGLLAVFIIVSGLIVRSIARTDRSSSTSRDPD